MQVKLTVATYHHALNGQRKEMHFHDNDGIARCAQMVLWQCDAYLGTFIALFMSLDIGITTLRLGQNVQRQGFLYQPPRYSAKLIAHIRFKFLRCFASKHRMLSLHFSRRLLLLLLSERLEGNGSNNCMPINSIECICNTYALLKFLYRREAKNNISFHFILT